MFLFFLVLQIAEGILPHRSALGFPGLAGGFTFTIYGWSSNRINSELFMKTVRSNRPMSQLSEKESLCKNGKKNIVQSGRL